MSARGAVPGPELQISVRPGTYRRRVAIALFNRKRLLVFQDPATGDDSLDYTEHAAWMGAIWSLELSQAKRIAPSSFVE